MLFSRAQALRQAQAGSAGPARYPGARSGRPRATGSAYRRPYFKDSR